MNLGHLLTQTARRFPDHIGVRDGDIVFTWAEVNDRVDRVAQALANRGVSKGDRVVVQARNSHRLIEFKWAIFKLGAVWAPVNFRLMPTEAAFIVQHSAAVAFVYDAEFSEHVTASVREFPSLGILICLDETSTIPESEVYPELIDTNRLATEATVTRDDPAWFFYTSGTSGRPKAAVLTHGQLTFVVANHLADMFPGANERDVSLVLAPLSHGAGIHALSFVARGATQVVFPGKSMTPDAVWSLVEKFRVSNFFAVPMLIKTLIEDQAVDGYDHSSLRFVNYGGAPMFRADLRPALKKLGPVLVQHYGLGEFTAAISCLPAHLQSIDLEDDASPIGTCGYPRVGTEVAIIGSSGEVLPSEMDGEICARGPACFSGYHNDDPANAKAFRDGWFHTGDIGHFDRRGLLYITGRASDMYISGGLNVYPREAEELILDDPRIAQVAIVGVPHPKWGECGVAIVVPRSGNALTRDEVLQILDGRLARFKLPHDVRFWPDLPKSNYGKILKREIVERLRSLAAERD